MCFLQQEFAPCTGVEEDYCTGICDNTENISTYNKRVLRAIDTMIKESPALAVFGPGRKISELSCILIDRNDVLSTGFVTHHALKMKKEKLEKQLTPASCNEFIRSLVLGYAEKNPALTVIF